MKDGTDAETLIEELGRKARNAADALAIASADRKRAALHHAADEMLSREAEILSANAKDLEFGRGKGLSAPMMDRLKLTPDRVRAMAAGVRAVAEQHDPVGEVIAEWTVPSGLSIRRVRTPLGVIGVIYESRPNVTADAGALCIKSGNAAILRGGSEGLNSSAAIHACMAEGLRLAGLPEDCVQMVPMRDREVVTAMLRASEWIDVVVPRGGRTLVELVQREARVPVFAHLEGICHVYVDGDADVEMARRVTLNAKTRRTGICGAAECLLVDRAFFAAHGAPMIHDLIKAGVEVRAEGDLLSLEGTVPAGPDDFGKEFLDMVIAARLVDGVDGAIDHIRSYGSQHTDAIITGNDLTAERFFARLDSAILLHNASTQFADGAEFGLGAEIGIATGKLHARGPVGAEQLTSFKYLVTGNGTIRA